METCVLVNNIEKYSGKYVATKTFKDKDVISFGDDPVKVFNDAKKAGADDPVVFYIPEKDTIHIYLCR
ncbi:MAG: hypothetical protein HY096_01990 [Nitrospinae bacterium]|nr:hypothetical protein [Nitrospinota bacterium]MBI5749342.1 hypothetical protein [Nitrospinota bacterium]